MSRHILVLHGPNLNLLGTREPEIYGTTTLDDINGLLQEKAKTSGLELKILQSNHEGALVDFLQKNRAWADGVLINPGALTHYGYSLHDAVLAIEKPTVEVHLSNIFAREEWRRKSVLSPACKGIISGFGVDSYLLGLEAVARIVTKTS
ncbi:3-dehydroquinate dehydratase [bacterium BMS3Abin05]|nr:3-dehydroquinate dehydratase [bacterium BMS3Abin05]